MREWQKLQLMEEACIALGLDLERVGAGKFLNADQEWTYLFKKFHPKHVKKGNIFVDYQQNVVQVASVEGHQVRLHLFDGETFVPHTETDEADFVRNSTVAVLSDSALPIPQQYTEAVWETIQAVETAFDINQYERLQWWYQINLRARILEALKKPLD